MNMASPLRTTRVYIRPSKGAAMILTFILSYLQRAPAFAWSPALNLEDNAIYSTLLPGTHS